jgi:hypothetical protein
VPADVGAGVAELGELWKVGGDLARNGSKLACSPAVRLPLGPDPSVASNASRASAQAREDFSRDG